MLFYVYLIDAEKDLGLPSLIDVRSSECKHKSMIPTLKIVTLFFSLLNWVLDSACAFSFTCHWPINILINYTLQCLAHFPFVWNCASPFHFGYWALSAHLDYSSINLNNAI
jgi:hypothetical protein